MLEDAAVGLGNDDDSSFEAFDIVHIIVEQASGRRPGLDGTAPEQFKLLPMRANFLLSGLSADRCVQGGLGPPPW